MKFFLMLALITIPALAMPQKYILLDPAITQPVTFSNQVTATHKFNGLFPVEKNSIKKFIVILEEIANQLEKEGGLGSVKQYKLGCCEFKGLKISDKTNGDRLDYVIISTCGNVKISMHLSNAKLKNSSNAYYINTWIKYIRNGLTKK